MRNTQYRKAYGMTAREIREKTGLPVFKISLMHYRGILKEYLFIWNEKQKFNKKHCFDCVHFTERCKNKGMFIYKKTGRGVRCGNKKENLLPDEIEAILSGEMK